ncbi:MAG: SAVED domain-containing protein [Rhodospirillaceae bacterium]|nr:SAVED domain-containing protein [Rhodospirillaceae bacterium]
MVSVKTRAVLWARGAGRCYYCNRSLIGDYESGNEDGNFGFVAHIVADTPGGPRGDRVRSSLLSDSAANLMLLCYPHHKLVDVDELANYPEARLLEMKTAHEDRVRIVTDLAPDRASHVLRYGAKVGDHNSLVAYGRVKDAMMPRRYPANGSSIGIEIIGSVLTDGEDQFWSVEPTNLSRQFNTLVKSRIEARDIAHLSVFALAPIPLLVQLGALLGDITPADIYQLHREPAGWNWAEDGNRIEFLLRRPTAIHKNVALKLAISADITDRRVVEVMGEDVSIWGLGVKCPGNDVMRNSADLVEFRRLIRSIYNDIKTTHGEDALIHVFPAIPVSCAVELGRVRMPKADLPLRVYDQTAGAGFRPRLTVP